MKTIHTIQIGSRGIFLCDSTFMSRSALCVTQPSIQRVLVPWVKRTANETDIFRLVKRPCQAADHISI